MSMNTKAYRGRSGLRARIGGGGGRRGLTLIEVLISVAITVAGIVTIINLFPTTMRGAEEAELRQVGAFLAFMKIEEIRRDMDSDRRLLHAIEDLTTVTDPVTFALEPRLAWRFTGRTLLHEHYDSSGALFDVPLDPRDDADVARVIIQISPEFRPGKPDVLQEYRFRYR